MLDFIALIFPAPVNRAVNMKTCNTAKSFMEGFNLLLLQSLLLGQTEA